MNPLACTVVNFFLCLLDFCLALDSGFRNKYVLAWHYFFFEFDELLTALPAINARETSLALCLDNADESIGFATERDSAAVETISLLRVFV